MTLDTARETCVTLRAIIVQYNTIDRLIAVKLTMSNVLALANPFDLLLELLGPTSWGWYGSSLVECYPATRIALVSRGQIETIALHESVYAIGSLQAESRPQLLFVSPCPRSRAQSGRFLRYCMKY